MFVPYEILANKCPQSKVEMKSSAFGVSKPSLKNYLNATTLAYP